MSQARPPDRKSTPALISLVALLTVASVSLGAWGCRRGIEDQSGRSLYERYCASCHGLDGKGNGPVAATMKVPPTDLTTLARRAGGRFDERSVTAVIDGRRAVEAHGPREMPVWGAVFDEELQERAHTQYTVLLRAQLLADYLRSIQVP